MPRGRIGGEPELRALLGEPTSIVRAKVKAFIRSQLWDPARHVDRSELPTSGEIHRSLDPSFDAETYDAERAERYARREGLS